MAKISELTLVTSLTGKEILPIVINNISNKKENKSITIDTLKQELITLGILDEDIIREIIFLAIEGNYVQMQDFNIAMSLKSDTTHNHDGVYSEKTHTHNYVDLKGLPTLPTFTDEQLSQFCNRVEDVEAQITNTTITLDDLCDIVQNMEESLSTSTSTQKISITQYSHLVNNGNWQQAFDEAIKDLGKGTLQIPKGTYVVNTIKIKGGIVLEGDGMDSTIIRSNNTIIEVETLESGYQYHIGLKDLQLLGNNQNIGINLGNSTHIQLENILIQNVNIGVLGNDTWLVNIYNTTVKNNTQVNECGFRFGTGTSVTMTRCWTKRVRQAYDLGTLHYSTLNSCGVDTFTEFAYNGGYAITYNSCGAEDAQLVEQGFVFGATNHSTFNSCECIRINTASPNTVAYLFNLDHASATINNFKLVSYEANTTFTTFKVNNKAMVQVFNGTFPSNHSVWVEFVDNNSIIMFFNETIKIFKKQEKYVLTDLYTNGYFNGGYTDTLIGKNAYNQYILPSNTKVKNSYNATNGGHTSTLNLLEVRTLEEGTYSFSVSLDIVGDCMDKGYFHYRAYLSCLSGTWQSPIITKVDGCNIDFSLQCVNNVVKLTCNTPWLGFNAEVTCTQSISTGSLEMKWL